MSSKKKKNKKIVSFSPTLDLRSERNFSNFSINLEFTPDFVPFHAFRNVKFHSL